MSASPAAPAPRSATPALGAELLAPVLELLDRVLQLDGRAASFDAETPLLGALPELDSLAVVDLITALEDRFGFSIDDDEIDGARFASVGTLSAFVHEKLSQAS